MSGPYFTIGETAKRLGINRTTVADLVLKLHIPAERHPTDGRAKAISLDGFRKIERTLSDPLPTAG
jgi:hypothetical protein